MTNPAAQQTQQTTTVSVEPLTLEQWETRAPGLGIPDDAIRHRTWFTGQPDGPMDTEHFLAWDIGQILLDGTRRNHGWRGAWQPWRCYRLEIFGQYAEWPTLDDPSSPHPPWPYLQIRLPLHLPGSRVAIGEEVITVRLRCVRGWREGAATWAELTWTDELTEQGSMGGFSHPETIDESAEQAEWRSARQALKFLQRHPLPTGGRPRGSYKGRRWSRDEYLDWYREASQAYARDGERLTLHHLGDAMGVSDDTASVRLRDPDVNLPWPPEAYPEVWDPDPEGWDTDD